MLCIGSSKASVLCLTSLDFVGGDNRLYVSGSLARIANEHGMVFVMFSDHAEDHSRDPLGLARFLKKRVRGWRASDENKPVTTPASKCQRSCRNMRALPMIVITIVIIVIVLVVSFEVPSSSSAESNHAP